MTSYDAWFDTASRGTLRCVKEGNGGRNCETCRLWNKGLGCSVYKINCTEIHMLNDMLTEAGIPHTFEPDWGGYHLCYPESWPGTVCSAILHRSSYGAHQGLIEIMGLLTPEEEENDSVAGYLTAEDVFGRIEKHWKEQNG